MNVSQSEADEYCAAVDCVEQRVIQVVNNSESLEQALIKLLSKDDETLNAEQKAAIAALPYEAQIFFIKMIVSSDVATEAAITTASTQAGITGDMGTKLYNAFAPHLVSFEDLVRQGNPLETAADSSVAPIGFGTGAGGGGGGGTSASTN